MGWNEEFAKALAELGSTESKSIEYRLHYNDQGDITMCSMLDHPISDNYLIVDQLTYDTYFKYRVNVSKKSLEKIASNLGVSVKLKKSDYGYKVVKNHAGLLIEETEEYNEIEYYAANN